MTPQQRAAEAAIYCRISRDRDGEGLGVERQRSDCEALAKRLKLRVAKVYVDNDKSAYSGKRRPEYEAMLKATAEGAFSALLAYNPDRLHRSTKELERFIDIVNAADAQVHTVNGGDYDLSTADGRMTARIIGTVSVHESERKAERLQRKHLELAEAGKPKGGARGFGYSCSNSPGCLVEGCAHDGVTIVAGEAAVIREAAAMVLAGATNYRIAEAWNAAGFPTPRGMTWIPQTVRRTLIAPRLAGLREYQGEVIGAAAWLPILDPETHAQVVAVLTNPARHHGQTHARKHALSGFCFCGICGRVLKAGVTNGKLAMMCKKTGASDACGRVVVKYQPLEQEVLELAIARIFLAPDLVAAANDSESHERREDRARLDALALRRERIVDAYEEGTISKPDYLSRLRAVDAERESIATTEAVSAGAAAVLANMEETSPEALRAAWFTKGLDWQRALLAGVFGAITVKPAAHKGQRFTKERISFVPAEAA